MEQRIIDQRLRVLKEKLMTLGSAAESALERAMQALTTRDGELARAVLSEDEAIDQMELEIDRMSVEILALQQPAAHDLRFVISVAKITPMLERIGDHAASIAETALVLNDEPRIKDYIDFPKMAEIAGDMLGAALEAFTSEDAEASRAIIRRDKEIDESYHRVFNELMEHMISDPSLTTCAAHLLFVAKHLERIGDYVKDICELNVYLREAVFIKHSSE